MGAACVWALTGTFGGEDAAAHLMTTNPHRMMRSEWGNAGVRSPEPLVRRLRSPLKSHGVRAGGGWRV